MRSPCLADPERSARLPQAGFRPSLSLVLTLILALVIATSACNGGDDGAGAGEDTTAGVDGWVMPDNRDAAGGVPHGGGPPDAASRADVGVAADAGPDGGVAEDVPAGAFGAACRTNEDCESGWCVASSARGYYCTSLCNTASSCPPDWQCHQIVNTGVDAAFGCFPPNDGCGVLSPCGDCDPFCTVATVGPGGDDPFLLFGEASDGVRRDESAVLVLDSEQLVLGLKYLWVANSVDDTVSQLDTHTGLEEGRYAVCDDPSRTAVDLWGNVYVGCRGDDRVAKIIVDEKLCPDRNGNTFTDTSRDLDGDGRVTGAEVLPLGEDECVAWIVEPLGADLDATVRGLAVDRFGKPWIGFYREVQERGFVVMQLDPFTGAVRREIDGLSAGAYGMALDQDGRLWLSGRDLGKLVRIDVEEDPAPVFEYVPEEICGNGHTLYGIVVDAKGRIWLGNSECAFVYRFDPADETWVQFPVDVDGLGNTRGIAADRDGNIVVAHHKWTCELGNAITVLDQDTGEIRKTILLDENGVTGPVGVAFDARGFLWAVNQCSDEAVKVDLDTEEVVLRQPVGAAPYTYSDMTGYNLRTFVVPSGYYRHIFAGWPQFGTEWRTFDLEAHLPAGAYLDVRVRTAHTVARLQSADWSPFLGPFPPRALPLDLRDVANADGDFLEVEVWIFAGASSPSDPPRLEGMEIRYTRAPEPESSADDAEPGASPGAE